MTPCCPPTYIVAHIICRIFFSQILPFISPFYSHCHFPKSEPHLSCCSSFLTGSLSPIFPSCSSEVGREQSLEDHRHIMDVQGKKNEQTGRKVTLIEVRGNQETVMSRSQQEGLGKAWSTRTSIKDSRSKIRAEKCLWDLQPRGCLWPGRRWFWMEGPGSMSQIVSSP